MNNDDINEYVPSLLNPRTIKKQHGDLTLTQNSIVSRCSLSLKRKNGLANAKKALHKTFPPLGKENVEVRSSLNCSLITRSRNTARNANGVENSFVFTPKQQLLPDQAVVPLASGKENPQNDLNVANKKLATKPKTAEEQSFGLSTLEDLNTTEKRDTNSSPFSFTELLAPVNVVTEVNNNEGTLKALSSHTELDDASNDKRDEETIVLDKDETLSTIVYEGFEIAEKQVTSISFSFVDCEGIQVSTNKSNIKKVAITQKDNAMNVDCQIEESSRATTVQSNDDVIILSSEDEAPPKKRNATVNLEIKKKTSTANPQEISKVLILNTNVIEKLSHVIVQPPNYKLVKRKIPDRSKFQNKRFRKPEFGNGKLVRGLKQKRIDSFWCGGNGGLPTKYSDSVHLTPKATSEKRASAQKKIPYHKFVAGTHFAVDAFSYGELPQVKYYFLTHFHSDHYSGLKKTFNKTLFCSKITAELCITRLGVNSKCIHVINLDEPLMVDGIEVLAVDANHCPGALMLVFTLPNGKTLLHTGDFARRPRWSPAQCSGTRTYTPSTWTPHAAAHGRLPRVAPDGVLPSVLEQGHTHYLPGLDTLLHTGDFRVAPDGVLPSVLEQGHTHHLPGLHTLLHTGDFRASPQMESCPVFWNKDIHTIYLDSTYCNPRYDFPTQEQCLEMALYLLRQKKLALEKAGRKFSSVLIVCGTYTIGELMMHWIQGPE
ncbi:DNA cross-link repair 1A protein isoform X1 [Phthorimaea operculella]|nr:DNA cross-link repair 1A protein isoform X1 [Phthorimaea operculella]